MLYWKVTYLSPDVHLMAKLYFRYSAMNAGKSTALLQVAHNYEERGMKVLILKPSIDSKWSDKLVSRLGISRKVDICFWPTDDLVGMVAKQPLAYCILVDEAQFCTPAQIDQLFRLAAIDDIPVICYWLRTDFMMNWFPGSVRLLEIAHELEELKTICRCGKKAIFSARIMNGMPVFAGEQIAIDNSAEVSYESTCGKCYLQKKMKHTKMKKLKTYK